MEFSGIFRESCLTRAVPGVYLRYVSAEILPFGGISVRRLSAAIGVVAILLGAVSAAKADIGAFSVSDQPVSQAPVQQTSSQSQADTGSLDLGLSGIPGSGAGLIPPQLTAGEPADQLPAEPASLSLVLAGLGSLGTWQLGRAARHAHFGDVPDWFHAGGPVQIGYAFIANPDCTPALDFSAFDQPIANRPVLHRMRCEPPLILQPQCILVTESPRGPPLLS